MRRKIILYIGNRMVDLDDQSFILFNYQMDDLSNPTIVKNSFSQQITLKGTSQNNRVFGELFRTDRRVTYEGGDTGSDFDPSRKTPFTIYSEMNEILESGYVKLDSVTRNGADIQYKVTLYGGLGSFFYALSYDANGNKRTLADLDYLGTGNSTTELNFTINRDAVLEAWRRLRFDTSAAEKWDVINFAPAYNGIPEGNFSPDKGLVAPGEVGLKASITEDSVTYTTRDGYCLVNLAEAQDEWAVKDLRSYLQRPIFSMRSFINAICNPDNNGGYEVDADAILDSESLGVYSDLWMTLPMISSIGSIHQSSGDLSLTMVSSATAGNEIGRFDISGSVPSGTKISAQVNCRIRFNTPSGADVYSELFRSVTYRYGTNTLGKMSAIFVQVVAYASNNSIVGGSNIKVLGNARGSGSALAQACGFQPAWNADYEMVAVNNFTKVQNGVFEVPTDLGFLVEAQDVASYRIMVYVYPGTSSTDTGAQGSTTRTEYSGDGSTSCPVMYATYDTGFTPVTAYIVQGSQNNSISYTSSETLRSGATITKAMLLSSSHTPAEYLLSFCKIFGLYFTYDVATKKVTIMKRNTLYQDEVIDLSRRVDTSKGVDIQPMVFNAKWYDFRLESNGGAFYEEYENTEGVPYGIQRVNTGYDFNADSVNLMDKVVFKNACTILAKSKYMNMITKMSGQTEIFQPSPFIDKGNTYTLWAATGETLETDISCPPSSANVDYYHENPEYKGYDIENALKLELRTADNKPIDGSDILVVLDGFNNYPYFKLTDDVPAMDVVNDGVPCWMLGEGGGLTNPLSVPAFSRYFYQGGNNIYDSLDFGTPKQMDLPRFKQREGNTIYERGWRNYIVDRYDVNTKVMKCRVDLSGHQVGQNLLRKFYWYEGSLWVLNRITNYSLTTYDPVECEFVQVQDKDNYLNGQTY